MPDFYAEILLCLPMSIPSLVIKTHLLRHINYSITIILRKQYFAPASIAWDYNCEFHGEFAAISS